MPVTNQTAVALILALTIGASAQAQTPTTNPMAAGGNATTYDMEPKTTEAIVNAAVAAAPHRIPDGPFKPSWDSLKENYRVPQWFNEARFGIFMHWGLYAVPAHHNEWYEKHMYSTAGIRDWHVQNFGPLDQFGYKDFIPKFTAEKYDPDAWAELFKRAGARFVIPSAQHHDNFALWDSDVTPFNAMDMGPKRDLIGEMAKAVRARGMKFGVSNHGIENIEFIETDKMPAALLKELQEKKADLFDPKWADFYNVVNRNDEGYKKFLVDWMNRNVELIEKYQPDMLWFDNGIDKRFMDPLKLWVAAYYYNAAQKWNKEVSLSTKKAAYAPSDSNLQTIGSIIDFEKVGARSPSGIRTGAWQVDDAIASSWGYTTDMRVSPPATIIGRLIDTVSKNGTYLLNISPKPDGTIPQDQQDVLLEIGKWLDTNGEAIYGTHNWIKFTDASTADRRDGGLNIRFTVKGDDLFAIILGNSPGESATIRSLATNQSPEGTITRITMLGASGDLQFTQTDAGLNINLPPTAPGKYAYTLKISGLKMNPPTATRSGNPE